MRFFRNFPEFRNFHDLGGHSRGNPRSGLIFMGGGGGGTINCVCLLAVFNILTINLFQNTESSQVSGVGLCTISTCTSIT